MLPRHRSSLRLVTPLLLLAACLPACNGLERPSDSDLAQRPGRIDLGAGPLAVQAKRFHKEILRLRPESDGYGVLLRHTTWNDPGGGSLANRERNLQEIERRVRRISSGQLEQGGERSRERLLTAVEREQERLALRLDHWRFDPATEPHTLAFAVANELPTGTPFERVEFFEAWKACGRTARERIDRLRESAQRDIVPPRSVIERTVGELEVILSIAPVRSPFLDVAKGGGSWLEIEPRSNIAVLAEEMYGDATQQGRLRRANLHLQEGEHLARGTRILVPALDDSMPVEGRGRFLAKTLQSIATDLYPAFLEYREFLLEELLPLAGDGSASTLAETTGGRFFYEELLRFHTTLDADLAASDNLHQLGLQWLGQVNAEIDALNTRTLRADSRQELSRMLLSDTLWNGAARDATLRNAIRRADARTPLGALPPAVRFATLDDGRSWTESSVTRDRLGKLHFAVDLPAWALEAAAFRAVTPGAAWLESRRPTDPLMLDRLTPAALVEGWGLHALRLAVEAGHFESDWSLFGALAMESLAAAIVVVDTGLHAKGWSREEAHEILARRTLASEPDIERTLDRVLADPGHLVAPGAGCLLFRAYGVRADQAFETYLRTARPFTLGEVARALADRETRSFPSDPPVRVDRIERIEAAAERDGL